MYIVTVKARHGEEIEKSACDTKLTAQLVTDVMKRKYKKLWDAEKIRIIITES